MSSAIMAGMTTTPERVNPAAVREIEAKARSGAAPGERILPIAIDEIVIDDNALPALAELVRRYATGGPVLMLVDRTTMHRGSDDLKQAVEATLRSVGPVSRRTVPDDPEEQFHADLESAQDLAAELRGYAAIVSVGSGSVTDVAKYARHLVFLNGRPHVPFISFPTAASVTAYSSALAVLTVRGVKRMLPSRPPEAVVCDLPALAGAPLPMTRAGYGNVLTRSVACGDWYLADQLGMDDRFSEIPGRLLEHAERAMTDVAENVAVGGPAGVRAVTEAVLLAGVAMSIVNRISTIGGWEHAISRYLDLEAWYEWRMPALHGAQVGVGTLIVARAYERAWPGLNVRRLARDEGADDTADLVEACLLRADTALPDCDADLREEILRDYRKKIVRWRDALPMRRAFARAKKDGDFEEFLTSKVPSSRVIESALKRAGAPIRLDKLEPTAGQSARNNAIDAVRNSHIIQSGFTLGDLLDFAGWLTPENASELIA